MKHFIFLLVFFLFGGVVIWLVLHFSGQTVSNESILTEEVSEPLPEPEPVPQFSVTIPNKIEIYDGISISENITQLDLSSRSLQGSLKAEIRQLEKLESLDLSDNNFTGLPAEVGQLANLRTLNLAGNPLTGLPHELGQLQKLEILDLRGTNYVVADLEAFESALPTSTSILIE